MGDAAYVEEKLRNAVDALATSAASIQERLFSAALAMHALRPEDFDDDALRVRFGALSDMLNWQEATGDEGTLRATASRMSDEQAIAAAREIFSLYAALTLRL